MDSTFTLANGMKVALLPKGTRGQAVHARLALHLGTEQSLFGSGEVPGFTAALLDRGTARLSRQQIEDRFNRLQAQVSFGGAGGSVNVGIVTVRTTGYNQEGVVVIRFQRTIMVYKRGHAPEIPRLGPNKDD